VYLLQLSDTLPRLRFDEGKEEGRDKSLLELAGEERGDDMHLSLLIERIEEMVGVAFASILVDVRPS